MSNALHDYANLFEKYAANNGVTGAILAGEDCLALANEMRMDADAIDAENAKLREYAHSLELDNIRLSSDNCDLLGEFETMSSVNVKLRELCVDIYEMCVDIYEMAYYEYPSAFETAFAERMRELGIEVSNGQKGQTQD